MKHALVLLIALSACTHQRTLSSLSELNGADVTITTHEYPNVHEDGVVVGDIVRTERGDFTYGEIKQLTEKSASVGAIEGLAIGLALGVIGGVAMGYASGDDADCEDCFISLKAGEKAAILGVAFGSFGGLGGLVVGALKGASFEYDF